ncbi:element excision factor XisI family protein [Candidatus Synechococcus calcipolaris]
MESDRTEVGVVNLLVEQGIDKKDIVLAYHAPYLHQYTEFGVD